MIYLVTGGRAHMFRPRWLQRSVAYPGEHTAGYNVALDGGSVGPGEPPLSHCFLSGIQLLSVAKPPFKPD